MSDENDELVLGGTLATPAPAPSEALSGGDSGAAATAPLSVATTEVLGAEVDGGAARAASPSGTSGLGHAEGVGGLDFGAAETDSAHATSPLSIQQPSIDLDAPEEAPAAEAPPCARSDKRPRTEKRPRQQAASLRSQRATDDAFYWCAQSFLAAAEDAAGAGAEQRRRGGARPSQSLAKTAKAVAKLVSCGNTVDLASNVFAEAAAWPPDPLFTFLDRSEWGGAEVPPLAMARGGRIARSPGAMAPGDITRLRAQGMPGTLGLREVAICIYLGLWSAGGVQRAGWQEGELKWRRPLDSFFPGRI